MTISPTAADAREAARATDGKFGEQQHTDPETGFSKKALAMFGLGPASVNTYAEPADRIEERTPRPYFALTPGDDDEFFDARPGTRLHMKLPNENGHLVEKRFVRSWQSVDGVGVEVERCAEQRRTSSSLVSAYGLARQLSLPPLAVRVSGVLIASVAIPVYIVLWVLVPTTTEF